MELSINSGRLIHYVEVVRDLGTTNDYGEPDGFTQVFDAWSEVQVKSGSEASKFGTTTTSEIITVLMWHDSRANNSMYIEWEGKQYRIQHIKPDGTRTGMIITAMIERNA